MYVVFYACIFFISVHERTVYVFKRIYRYMYM